MTGSHQNDIEELLSESSVPEYLVTSKIVASAFLWWMEVVSNDDMDRIEAYKCLIEMSKAIKIGDEFVSEVLPELIEVAKPGQKIVDIITTGRKDLEQIQIEIDNLQNEIAPLVQQENELRALVKSHEDLKKRKEELIRLSKLAAGVEELRSQVTELEKRLPDEGKEANSLEDQIDSDSSSLIVISEKHLGNLREGMRKMLELCEKYEEDLKIARENIDNAKERYSAAQEALAEHLDVLRLYEEADREVADALGGQPEMRDVTKVLNEIKDQLVQVDSALRKAVLANEEANKLTRLTYAGR